MFTPEQIGDNWAEHLDAYTSDREPELDPAQAVAFLKEMSGGGPVLELGIGTGRVAIPLAQAGTIVHGIDISEEMLRVCKSKYNKRDLRIWCDDFSSFVVQRQYPLIYTVYNGILMLHTRMQQASCFQCVYKALCPGGRLVIEAWVPSVERFGDEPLLEVAKMKSNCVEFRATLHRQDEQQLIAYHIWLRDGQLPALKPMMMRYASPSELDELALDAGLTLKERYSDWARTPFKDLCERHISVYLREE